MKFITHMHVRKNQPILVRVLQAYQTFFFLTWNFVNRLNQTFLQITFSLLADTGPIKFQRQLIDLSKTEKCVCSQRPAAHILSSFLYMIGLFIRPQTQRERNVVRFSAAISGEEHCKDKITEFVMVCDCDWLPIGGWGEEMADSSDQVQEYFDFISKSSKSL